MKITQKSKYQKVPDCQYWSENISSIPLIEEICIFLYIFCAICLSSVYGSSD